MKFWIDIPQKSVFTIGLGYLYDFDCSYPPRLCPFLRQLWVVLWGCYPGPTLRIDQRARLLLFVAIALGCCGLREWGSVASTPKRCEISGEPCNTPPATEGSAQCLISNRLIGNCLKCNRRTIRVLYISQAISLRGEISLWVVYEGKCLGKWLQIWDLRGSTP